MGNAHPSAFFDVLSDAAGSHHVACAERFLYTTGKPVEPHSPLPAGLEVKWMWVPLLENMFEPLGLVPECLQYEYAKQMFEESKEEGAEREIPEQGSFLPSCQGFVVILGDGVETRLRFRIIQETHHTWHRAELRFPDRNIAASPDQDVSSMTHKVISYFEKPHRVIQMSEEARSLFTAFQAGWNVQAAVGRCEAQTNAAGRLGTAAWQLAVLACANLVFEIAAGDVDPSKEQVVLSHSKVSACQPPI